MAAFFIKEYISNAAIFTYSYTYVVYHDSYEHQPPPPPPTTNVYCLRILATCIVKDCYSCRYPTYHYPPVPYHIVVGVLQTGGIGYGVRLYWHSLQSPYGSFSSTCMRISGKTNCWKNSFYKLFDSLCLRILFFIEMKIFFFFFFCAVSFSFSFSFDSFSFYLNIILFSFGVNCSRFFIFVKRSLWHTTKIKKKYLGGGISCFGVVNFFVV